MDTIGSKGRTGARSVQDHQGKTVSKVMVRSKPGVQMISIGIVKPSLT